VLSLLDQLYETRRQMRRLCSVLESAVPDDMRRRIFDDLGDAT
jgi:hypothetical protein